MFHSIRWRLTASFTLLTLLTVTLLGLLVLRLMQQSLERQANDYLNANAEAVARQSQLFFQPAPQRFKLNQLAQTAAFLGDVQVRILDDEQKVLADSGTPGLGEQVTWIVGGPGAAPSMGARPVDFIAVAPMPIQSPGAAYDPAALAAVETASGFGIVTVRRMPSPWGDRLDFQNFTASDHFTTVTGPFSSTLFTASIASAPATQVALARSPMQVLAPIETGSDVVGWVEMGSAPDFATATLAVIRQAFLIAAAVVTLLSVALGLIVSRGLTAPLEGLTAATVRMDSGDLTARAPIHGRDEIGLLARQFNQMAAALERSFAAIAAERDALRRFIADASHELRTPLTALRTFSELLLGQAGGDPAAQREFLVESQGQIDRLERITNNLLNLSRLEGGLIQLQLAPQKVVDLVQSTVAPLKTIAQDRQLDLHIELPDPTLMIEGDARQLESALTNLVENALKYTPAGGQVQVGAGLEAGKVAIWVKDNGRGIPADELPFVFERFHRGRTAGEEGSGLGLAIAQRIVQAHGGQITAASQEGVGSRFTMLLPAAERTGG